MIKFPLGKSVFGKNLVTKDLGNIKVNKENEYKLEFNSKYAYLILYIDGMVRVDGKYGVFAEIMVADDNDVSYTLPFPRLSSIVDTSKPSNVYNMSTNLYERSIQIMVPAYNAECKLIIRVPDGKGDLTFKILEMKR